MSETAERLMEKIKEAKERADEAVRIIEVEEPTGFGGIFQVSHNKWTRRLRLKIKQLQACLES